MSEVIPEGWSAHELEDLISKIEGGGTPSRTNPAFWNGQVPWATVKDLKGIRLSVTEESITEQGLSTSASRLVPANTPIIATRMAVGKVVVFDRAVAINQDLKAIYPSPRLDAEFLLYWYSAHSDQVANLATGSTVKGIRLEILRALLLTLPPLPEQQKIATILSSVDDVIEKTRAQIDKLKNLKTGMMQELLTQGIGHTEFKDSPLGRIPKTWTVSKLVEVCDLQVGYAFKSSWFVEKGIRLLRGENVGFGQAVWEQTRCLSETQAKDFESYQIFEGDIIIGMDRTFTNSGIKITRLRSNDAPALLVQRVGRFVDKSIDIDFLWQVIRSPRYLDALKSQEKGMDIPHLSKTEILDIPIVNPPLLEQRKIATILTKVDDLIETIKQNLDHCLRLKKALMQDLLTGKVRVKPDSPEVAAA